MTIEFITPTFPLDEIFVSAIKVGVPVREDLVREIIDAVNERLAYLPVLVTGPTYEEFIDHDRDTEEYGYTDRHDCFDFDLFAEFLSDLWNFVNVLHRNGDNDAVRRLRAYLDAFIIATDVVDHTDVLGL